MRTLPPTTLSVFLLFVLFYFTFYSIKHPQEIKCVFMTFWKITLLWRDVRVYKIPYLKKKMLLFVPPLSYQLVFRGVNSYPKLWKSTQCWCLRQAVRWSHSDKLLLIQPVNFLWPGNLQITIYTTKRVVRTTDRENIYNRQSIAYKWQSKCCNRQSSTSTDRIVYNQQSSVYNRQSNVHNRRSNVHNR